MVFMLEYSVIVLDHFRNAESTPQCQHFTAQLQHDNNQQHNGHYSAIEDRIESAIDALHDGLYTSPTIGK